MNLNENREFIKEWLEQEGEASISLHLIGFHDAAYITAQLGCWCQYNRATETFHFKR